MDKTDENINEDTYQTVKSNKGRTTKVHAINIKRKRILNKEEKKHYRIQKIEKQERQTPKQHCKLAQGQLKPQKIHKILK